MTIGASRFGTVHGVASTAARLGLTAGNRPAVRPQDSHQWTGGGTDMASRKSISRRQRYAQDPEYRESVLARSRRYRATHKEKLRAYERQRRYGLSDADYEAMLA